MNNEINDIDSNCFFDLHVHSHYSYDCKSHPDDLIRTAEKLGLAGLAITDHNNTKFHHQSHTETSVIIVPGIEISTKKGHIIALGVVDTLPKKLSVEETIDLIRDLSGEIICPHPFDFTRQGVGRHIRGMKNIAIETMNASCFHPWFNNKAKNYAEKHDLAETGGSDSHRLQDLGMAYTIVNEGVETTDDLLEALRKKKTSGAGTNISILQKIIRSLQIHF